jgi:putative ABC transport system ATP-binding protein
MKGPLIRLENVTKHYKMGDSIVKAVDGITIDIFKGDFVAIMEPSGSGKSTAMNLVGSLDLATRGKILLNGHDIGQFGESDLAQLRGQKIGFIFQSFNLIPNLIAKENIMFPMIFQGIGLEFREKRAEELLKIVELENGENHYPNQLSDGQ